MSRNKKLEAKANERAYVSDLRRRLDVMKFALEEICEVANRAGYTDKDRAVCSMRIAKEALGK